MFYVYLSEITLTKKGMLHIIERVQMKKLSANHEVLPYM